MNKFVPFYFDGCQSDADGLNASVRSMDDWGRLLAAAIMAGIPEKLMQAQLGRHQRVRDLPTFGFEEQDIGYNGETLRTWLEKNKMFLPTAIIITTPITTPPKM